MHPLPRGGCDAPFTQRFLTLKSGLNLIAILAVLAVSVQLLGCSTLGLDDALPDQRLIYKKQSEASENLEVPPDLVGSRFDDALDIPDGGAPATFSGYTSGRAQRQQVAASGTVLPAIPNVELKRTEKDRWLEMQASPQQTWPKLIAFWREQGILLAEQDPTVGVMKTDWLDNRAEIRQGFLTRMVGKIAEGLYATSTRDQYTVRIEDGMRAGMTEIHLVHRGMEEKLVTSAIGDGSRTVWEPSGNDSAKEAEMLRRLMVFLGGSKSTAATVGNGADSGKTAFSTQAPRSRLVAEGSTKVLLIPEDFRSAWRLSGSALDRAGFAVEDRNQSEGLYYVRYAGKDAAGDTKTAKPGLASRLAFWRKNDIDQVKQYRIQVVGKDRESQVSVLDANGKPDQSETAGRILTLMQENMR